MSWCELPVEQRVGLAGSQQQAKTLNPMAHKGLTPTNHPVSELEADLPSGDDHSSGQQFD